MSQTRHCLQCQEEMMRLPIQKSAVCDITFTFRIPLRERTYNASFILFTCIVVEEGKNILNNGAESKF